MPPAIISHPEFKALMTAQIQTFLQANPVTTTLSRAARWGKLKVDIQDVARNYCSTFRAQRMRMLRVLSVRASQARAAYVAASQAAGCHRCLAGWGHALRAEGMVFLDSSKAYDRLSRPWVLDCMSSMAFGEHACEWVSIKKNVIAPR